MLQNLSHIESLLFQTVFLWDLDVGLDRAAAWRIHGAVLGAPAQSFLADPTLHTVALFQHTKTHRTRVQKGIKTQSVTHISQKLLYFTLTSVMVQGAQLSRWKTTGNCSIGPLRNVPVASLLRCMRLCRNPTSSSKLVVNSELIFHGSALVFAHTLLRPSANSCGSSSCARVD